MQKLEILRFLISLLKKRGQFLASCCRHRRNLDSLLQPWTKEESKQWMAVSELKKANAKAKESQLKNHLHWLPEEKTINTGRLVASLDSLLQNLSKNWSGELRHRILFQHDSTKKEKMSYGRRTGNFCLIPDLAPNDYHLFGPMKKIKLCEIKFYNSS